MDFPFLFYQALQKCTSIPSHIIAYKKNKFKQKKPLCHKILKSGRYFQVDFLSVVNFGCLSFNMNSFQMTARFFVVVEILSVLLVTIHTHKKKLQNSF